MALNICRPGYIKKEMIILQTNFPMPGPIVLNLKEQCVFNFFIFKKSHGQMCFSGPISCICNLESRRRPVHHMALSFSQTKFRKTVGLPIKFFLPSMMRYMDTYFFICRACSFFLPSQIRKAPQICQNLIGIPYIIQPVPYAHTA